MAQIILDEGAAPSTPASGKAAAYAKTDGLLYSKDDAGQEDRLSGIQEKILSATRDLTAATGSVAYTGVGFKPRLVEVFACVDGGLAMHGVFDATTTKGISQLTATAWYTTDASALYYADTSGANYQSFSVSSMDSDGFTLSWSKTGTPTGTLNLKFRCLR